MNLQQRIIIAGILILGSVAALVYLNADESDNVQPQEETIVPPVDGHGAMNLKSSEDCKECHQAVWEEWKQSHHEFAWRNPEPRRKELSDNFKNKDCIPCHAPRPLIEVGYGKRPLEREDNRDDGVNCMTCHRYKNVMAAANDLSPAASDAPCNPVTWAPIREMNLCAPCHDQHKVNRDWSNTRFAVEGSDEYMDCNDCHMPLRPGPGTKGGTRKTHRDHRFAGAHDAEVLKTAATLRAEVIGAEAELASAFEEMTGRRIEVQRGEGESGRLVIIEVKNTGTGHNFPADERHRAVDLEATHLPPGRAPGAETRLTRFRNPYRHEFEILNPFQDRAGETLTSSVSWDGQERGISQVRVLPDFNPDREVYYPKSTQLAAGESRILWFPADLPHQGKLRLRLYYKLNPYMKNDDAVVCNELEIDL